MNKYTFDEIQIGMEESFEVTITEEMMDRFYLITKDCNPLHRDEAFAREKGFEKQVVYGMLTASFLSTLAGVYLPGENSLIQSVETMFKKPVFVGDTLRISGKVSEKIDAFNCFKMKVVMTNQNEEKVLKGTMQIGVMNE